MQTLENLAETIRKRHDLSSLNIWHAPIAGIEWHSRAFRHDPKGFQASVESGGGRTIREALVSLDERLTAGPINKRYIPILDPEPKTVND